MLFIFFSLVAALALGNSCNHTSQRTYFIGNSFTYYNDMPTIYENILNEALPQVRLRYVKSPKRVQ